MRLIFSILIFVLSSQLADAQVQLRQVAADPGQYIVTFVTPAMDTRLASRDPAQRKQTMRDLRESMAIHIDNLKQDMAGTDLTVIRQLWLRQAAAIHLSPEHLTKLRSLGYVSEVNPDRSYQVEPQGTLPSGVDVGDDIERINFDELWSQGFRGQGVVVAILDTGVDYLHKDLQNSWRGGSNSWFDPYGEFDFPVDTLTDGKSHGTGVASVVLGGNLNETGNYLGVAPEASWIAARIIDGQNTTESAISSALEWVLDPDGDPATDDYPDVVQNSWGLSGSEGSCSNPFTAELAAIDAAGIDIVFSVGNTSTMNQPQSFLSPSFDKNVISVGAINSQNNNVWVNSARGPDKCNTPLVVIPSLVAPGQLITVADWTIGGLKSNLDNVTVLSGTSFAAPMVSGALALLHSKYQANDHRDFRQSLYDSSLQLGAVSPNSDYGHGLVQVSDAAALLKTEADRSTSGVTYVTPVVNFSMAKYSFAENTTATVSVTILRSGDISNAASVQVVSTNGTAKAGSDFEAVDSTVDFLANEGRKTLTITLINDTNAENDETFNLLFSAPNSINFGSKNSISIVITDDDKAAAEEVIGGASVGLLELLVLLTFTAGRLVTRWV